MTADAFSVPRSVATHAARLGAAGHKWLARLPAIVRACVERWELEIEAPYEELWYNCVVKARLDGQPVVLKVCHPGHETVEEATALRHFDGRMCVRLLDYDPGLEVLLLERAEPGEMIETLRDGVAEIAAAAALMRGLWRPPPPLHSFPLAVDWLNAALAPESLPGTKRLYSWVVPALERAAEMQADKVEPLLLHGDLHQGNILSAQREPWLAIDPKGVVGDAAWEVAPFLFNSLKRDDAGERPRMARRRADQFADELSFDRARLYTWSVVRALQSAFWSLRDDTAMGRNWQAAMACAEELSHGP